MDLYTGNDLPKKIYDPPLNWIEWENRISGQIPLFKKHLIPSVAERCFVLITEHWLNQDRDNNSKNRRSEQLIELQFAGLYLAAEYGEEFSDLAETMATNCYMRALNDIWYISLPWQITLELLHKRPYLHELIANLDHHKSDVRLHMIEIGWFVKKMICGDNVKYKLLKNIADTIIAVPESAGLFVSLFENKEEIKEFISNYTPEDDFAKQYSSRIEYFDKHGWECCELYQLENKILKNIEKKIIKLRLSQT